ncbi:MAG TPA: YtxH domain-containing protein [Ginsengibacter sp.]|nr:YtxH domain-containing protein [Ginsengibacter sp.]
MIRTLKVFAAGVVFGVLFAPNKGTKTRRKLAKVFSNCKEDAKDYLVDTANNVESKVEAAKDAIKKI